MKVLIHNLHRSRVRLHALGLDLMYRTPSIVPLTLAALPFPLLTQALVDLAKRLADGLLGFAVVHWSVCCSLAVVVMGSVKKRAWGSSCSLHTHRTRPVKSSFHRVPLRLHRTPFVVMASQRSFIDLK
jgi:hypothetical protein